MKCDKINADLSALGQFGCLLLRLGVVLLCFLLPASHGYTDTEAWPMLAHDAARSGTTPTEIRPGFERKWYRLFPDEGLMAGMQPVIAYGKVFIGTMRGTLHAIDGETGEDVWKCKTTGPVLHTCAAAEGKIFFGTGAGRVCAVNAADGKPVWSLRTDTAVWNSPLVHDGLLLIGGRDGKLYAIKADSGAVWWVAQTGGPLLSSPALDVRTGRVYIGCEDMHVYAFDLETGGRLWQSAKLPGVSFRGYHPVVAPDSSVMVTVTPAMSLDSFNSVLYDMVREVFGDFASWRHTNEENDRLRDQNFKLMEEPGTYLRQLDYIRKRLEDEPAYQTFFVLDGATGRRKFVAPIVYAESMNGTGAPPIVTPDGKVIVKYRVLLRSRYQHYSPFLNVGYLDTSTGWITPIMDQARTYGWHDSLLLVHDEQCQLSAGGRVLINTHQDNVNAMDLDTLKGYGEPFCRNIHEPKPGEAVGIWATILRGRELPPGKEWLARGTAVYGGGSAIDTPVSIAGDSFYYIPTHEINAGAAVIAYRMKTNGTAGRESEPPAAELVDDEWRQIQRLRWDWDTLDMPRLDHVTRSLADRIAERDRVSAIADQSKPPLTISDDQLDALIWEQRNVDVPRNEETRLLRKRLGDSIEELVSKQWQPLVFPAGKHPGEAYRFFVEPTETLYTLARAYTYLDSDLQQKVYQYVETLSGSGGPLEAPVGGPTFSSSTGAVRSLYDVPDEEMLKIVNDIARNDVARLYPVWLWAQVRGDFSQIESHWGELCQFVDKPANKMEEDCHNGYAAGLIAYCRMAAQMNDRPALEKGLGVTRGALRNRLAYEFEHPRGGVMTRVPVMRTIIGRWRHLTPEVGRLLAMYSGDMTRYLMDVYIDYHRPTWYLAWGIESMWRNETAFAFPTMAGEIFDARALILNESAGTLERFLDIPWCRADLFYIQKMTLCLEAHGTTTWRRPSGGL